MIVKLNTSCGIVSIWDNAQVISSFLVKFFVLYARKGIWL